MEANKLSIRKSRIILVKYLLLSYVLAAFITILLTLSFTTFGDNSGRGYAVGISIAQKDYTILGLQLILSVVATYFAGPHASNSIYRGNKALYVGTLSYLICWALPWIILNLAFNLSAIRWKILMISSIVAILPCLMIGPVAGLALKKLHQKPKI